MTTFSIHHSAKFEKFVSVCIIVARMVLSSLTWFQLGMYRANTQGSHHWRQFCQAPWMHLQFCPANLSMLQLPAGAGLWLPGLTAQTGSAHIPQKTPGPCYLWVFWDKEHFPLCLKLDCVHWTIYICSHTHLEISTLQSCTWHTLVRHTKAVFSGTKHRAAMSCKCRILSNITIAVEGSWKAPGSELGSAQIHWNTLRKFQSLTSRTCA